MNLRNPKTIHDILAAERSALMAADFDRFDQLAQAKPRALDTFIAQKPTTPQVENIRTQIQQNQALLQASISGIETARARIADLYSVQQGFDHYTASGQRDRQTTTPPELNKQA